MLYMVVVIKKGYAQAIKDFDERLPELIDNLRDDLVIITADRGNDPVQEQIVLENIFQCLCLALK